MAHISFSKTFFKEVIQIFRERSLKEIIFGKHVKLSDEEREILSWIKGNKERFVVEGGRAGQFNKRDLIHKGRGNVYLLASKFGNKNLESIVVFDDDVVITPGPDLYLYLSTESDVGRNGLGNYLDLGLLKGTKGGQIYVINSPIISLSQYKSAVIWCKQFSVLFSFAVLK